MKNIKLLILMIAITFMTILTGCEMTVNQDESALVMELDALGTAIDTLDTELSNLEVIVETNAKEFNEALKLIVFDIGDIYSRLDSLDQTDIEVEKKLKNLNKKLNKFKDCIKGRVEALELVDHGSAELLLADLADVLIDSRLYPLIYEDILEWYNLNYSLDY